MASAAARKASGTAMTRLLSTPPLRSARYWSSRAKDEGWQLLEEAMARARGHAARRRRRRADTA